MLTRGIISAIIPLALEGIPQREVGVYNIEVPPVPIPNTVVKLNRAENTWRAAAREDRSSPAQAPDIRTDIGGSFFCLRQVLLLRSEIVLCTVLFASQVFLQKK